MFAENPSWLADAYAEPINISDTGIVQRNLAAAKHISATILACLNRKGRFLDDAGGTGLLVRLMRDRGFDFLWRDPYATNLFARGFEPTGCNERYEAITWLECAEHVPDPLDAIAAMLRQTDVIIFSTLLLPCPAPKPDEWWYYGWEHGQHVSFYTYAALEALAARLDARLLSDRTSWHMLATRPIAPPAFRLALRLARYIDLIGRRLILRPLTEADNRLLRTAGGNPPAPSKPT